MISGLISLIRGLAVVALASSLPAIGVDGQRFVVVWFDEDDNSYFDLEARRFSSAGAPVTRRTGGLRALATGDLGRLVAREGE
jgi:hypothetical protein